MEPEDVMKNIVRNSSSRCLPGSLDNPALHFVSHGNYHVHPVTPLVLYKLSTLVRSRRYLFISNGRAHTLQDNVLAKRGEVFR